VALMSNGRYIVKADYKRYEDRPNLSYQTEREIRLWHSLSPKDKRYFPNLIDYGTYESRTKGTFFWLVQERIRTTSTRVNRRMLNTVNRLEAEYEIEDLGWLDPGDDLWDTANWTIRDNRPVIYDFGLKRMW